jgi:hypothetical protein
MAKRRRTDNTMAKGRTDNTMAKRTNNDLQNTTQKNYIYRATRTPLKTGCELRCSGRVNSACSTSDTCGVTLVTTPVISH